MQCEVRESAELNLHLQSEIVNDEQATLRTNPFISEQSQVKHVATTMVRDEDEDAFYFLTSQQDQLSLSPALSASSTCELDPDNIIDLATRIFYATCHKFTAVAQQPARYSFRQSLLLHSMYSKSQQTLLGLESIRPTVLLSGEDFMFTPPVPAVDWSLNDWALDAEDDSFLEGCHFTTSDGERDQTGIQNNNMVTDFDTYDVVDGDVSEVLIPHSLRVSNADIELEVGNETAKKVLAKELSNWFTTNHTEKVVEPFSDDAQHNIDDDDESIVKIEEIEESESASLSSTCTSSGVEAETNESETSSDKVIEVPTATTPTPEPLASILQELEAHSSALTQLKPNDTMSNEANDLSESMKAPKHIHSSLNNYVSTLQSLVKQKMQDSSVVQTVTANGVRVKTSIGFFTKWMSWLSSIIKVWKLFFLIAESLLVSFGDVILQSIIIHTLGRQLESAPALVAT
ncbi:hypothetical protein INT43_004360 [Umbelopsis isabellina]|uniref:Uncharacterized protein n=1 Tax=Mortierella isabellina TaxID=91625 RepID=A0A8H7UAF8_MORIS|nr:hypothetical protein INT43_004360 [Umbelopsis isabellina]